MDLSHLPIFDHHARPLLHEQSWREVPLETYFTEGNSPALMPFVQDNLFFRRSLHDLAEFYGCEPTHEAVLVARQNQDYLDLCRFFFAESNITHLLLDDGVVSDKLWSLEESSEQLPPKVRRIVRLETEFIRLIEHYDTASKLLQTFEGRLRVLAPVSAAFKSITAHRNGDIGRFNVIEIERAYADLRRTHSPGQTLRINSKPLTDAMLWTALRVASETKTVVQFHVGYGDPDLDLRMANPLHLRNILEAPDLRGLKSVLLHGYPYMREAGYLASVYPGVYLDLGLSIPYTSLHGMQTLVHEALHLAPVSKVMFSTGAQRSPELFWLAARWGRRVIGQVLTQTAQTGDLSRLEAEWAAERILNLNAERLYGLPIDPLTKTTAEIIQE